MRFTFATQHDRDLDELAKAALAEAELDSIGSAYVSDVRRRTHGGFRAHENIYPASVIKVPIMAEAYRQYSVGTLDPEERVTVSRSNQTTTAERTPFVPGFVARVQELVELMVTHSDNVATNQLIDVLRRENVTQYMRRLGLHDFLLGRKLSGSEPLIEDSEMVGRNRLPAAEIGLLLGLIASDALPGAPEQRHILSRCVHDQKLASGLQPGDVFAHKTGETDAQSHDAGILTTPGGGEYVIVLYTTPPPKPDGSDASHADHQLARFMRALRRSL